MELVDTHAHIYLRDFADNSEEMLEKARKEGVSRIFMPAIDSSTHAEMLAFENEHPNCRAMMGLHPCSVKANYREELKICRDYLENRDIIAVGEIGLDYYWDRSFTREQLAAFHEQIGWALSYDIPIVIHSRDALDACLKAVKEQQKGKLKGVFHCFSGNSTQAQKIIDLNFYLGIGGVVTFKNGGLDKLMPEIPLDRVVLETDAPYLAPVPFRGKRNEPAYLRYVVEKISSLKKIAVDEVARVTTENAEKLFG